jgi:flagellar biosynthesis protein
MSNHDHSDDLSDDHDDDRSFMKPTRFAAAIRYREHDQAPVVTAKGDGFVADEIVKRAIEAGIPIHASKELAALVRDVPLEHAIPPQMYRVIAELLAWVYQLEHAVPAQLKLEAPRS